MTELEAIKDLKSEIEKCYKKYEGKCSEIEDGIRKCRDGNILSALSEILKYKQVGTVEECKETVDRKKLTDPVILKGKFSDTYICPKCGYELIHEDETGCFGGKYHKFCPDCGQAIEWDN